LIATESMAQLPGHVAVGDGDDIDGFLARYEADKSPAKNPPGDRDLFPTFPVRRRVVTLDQRYHSNLIKS